MTALDPFSGTPDGRLRARIGIAPQLDEPPVVLGGRLALATPLVDLGAAQVAGREVGNIVGGGVGKRRVPAQRLGVVARLAVQLGA
ncbi:MAG TPA: hypothetical protein VGR27_10980 [Longimicrobiaceae bacterium]|nr:hypothetical protein [Longimicrobiaceae bacterium]